MNIIDLAPICGLTFSIGFLAAMLVQCRRDRKEKWRKFNEWQERRKNYLMEEPCPVPIKEVSGETVWVENCYAFGPGMEHIKGEWRQKYEPV